MNQSCNGHGDWLDAALRAVRDAEIEAPPPARNDCFSFAQARKLALQGRAACESDPHLAGCKSCAGLAAKMSSLMPHASLWELSMLLLGAESGEFARKHVDEDRCGDCIERLDSMRGAANRLVHRSHSISLPLATAARADTLGAELEGCSPDGSLEFTLICEAEEASLELRSRSPEMEYGLVAYRLLGADSGHAVSDFAVLEPDVDGWYATEIRFQPRRLYRELGETCRGVSAAPINTEQLSEEEQIELATLVSRRAGTNQAWRTWSHREAGRAHRYAETIARVLKSHQNPQ